MGDAFELKWPGADPRRRNSSVSTIRTCRPLLVDATQCKEAKTIATDLGFSNVKPGDWIIRGEDGECYVVDDVFFQRTFTSIHTYEWEHNEEGRSYGC
jgi:hypothetical protein